MKKYFAILIILVPLSIALAACHRQRTIKTPISEALEGRWVLVGSMKEGDDKHEEKLRLNGDADSKFYYYFRQDSSMINIRTRAGSGLQDMRRLCWRADDVKKGFYLNGAFFPLLELTEDWMMFRQDSIFNPDTGNKINGKFVFLMMRVENEPSLIENLVGKWKYDSEYDKIDGKWTMYRKYSKEYDNLKEDGSFTSMFIDSLDGNWAIDSRKQLLVMDIGIGEFSMKFGLKGDTLILSSDRPFDYLTGEREDDDYRYELVRE